MILKAIGIGIAIGAGVGLVSTAWQDFKNGKLFDGDVTLLSYLGNTLGGGIAGIGTGLFSILGAGVGVALSTGTTLTIFGTAVSGGVALSLGTGGALLTGGIGYAVRVGISDQETFEWSDMYIEAGANAVSGLLSFGSSTVGGAIGIKVPGVKSSIKNLVQYHGGITYFGVYTVKFLFSKIKQKLKERY